MQIPQTRTRGVMVMLLVLMPNVVEALTALLLPAPALMLNGTVLMHHMLLSLQCQHWSNPGKTEV